MSCHVQCERLRRTLFEFVDSIDRKGIKEVSNSIGNGNLRRWAIPTRLTVAVSQGGTMGRTWRYRMASAIALVLTLATTALGQQVLRGSIAGTIKDDTGAALPG